MIIAFQSIEAAGEVEATLVAGGIKVALLTTAAGLVIAIPVSISHNFFVSRIDSLVIDMETFGQTWREDVWLSSGKGGLHYPGMAHLNAWTISRLWWDVDQDVDVLLAEYY